MVGQLGRVDVTGLEVPLLERVGDGEVETGARDRSLTFVQRLAEQRVGEPVATDARFTRRSGGDGNFQEADQLGHGYAAGAGHDVDGELLARDRGEGQHVDAPLRQPHHAPLDHLAHTLRHADRDVVSVERVLGGEQSGHLADKQRVPGGLPVDCRGELGAKFGAGRRSHQLRDIVRFSPRTDRSWLRRDASCMSGTSGWSPATSVSR